MVIFHKRLFVMLALAAIFIFPGTLAFFLYKNPQWVPTGHTNKGYLITPPIAVKPLTGKWGLVLWYPQSCTEVCLRNLEKAHRVLLALGRHYAEVSLWCLQPAAYLQDNAAFEKIGVVQTLGIAPQSSDLVTKLGEEPRFFIVDPRGYFILSYPGTVHADDVYHDMKKLLKNDTAL